MARRPAATRFKWVRIPPASLDRPAAGSDYITKHRLIRNLRWPITIQSSTARWEYIVTTTTLRYRASGDRNERERWRVSTRNASVCPLSTALLSIRAVSRQPPLDFYKTRRLATNFVATDTRLTAASEYIDCKSTGVGSTPTEQASLVVQLEEHFL